MKGAKGYTKKSELDSEDGGEAEKDSVSSFDTETPPSLSPATKRKKCSQFSLSKSPSIPSPGRKKNNKKVVVSKRVKNEAKAKPRKRDNVVGGVIDLVSKQKQWDWEDTMKGSSASYGTGQSKSEENSDDEHPTTIKTDNFQKISMETQGDYYSSDDENKKMKAKPAPLVASGENLSTNVDTNRNTAPEETANTVPNDEMLAHALKGQIAALSRANDESGIRRLLSMITNTIVTTGVATLEPVIPDMRVVYKGTTQVKDGTPDETVGKKTDE